MKKAYLQMHLCIFLWGFTGILGRLIELNEGLLVWYRLVITSLLLCLYVFFWKKFQKLSPKETLKVCFVGVIVAVHWLFFYAAIKYSNVSVTLSCLASSALFTSLFEPLILKDSGQHFKINFFEIFLALAAASGIYLIFSFENYFGTGIVLALIASALGALFTVINKKFVSTHSPLTVTFIELGSGTIFLTLLLPLYLKFFPTEKILPDSSDWFYLFCLSFFCTVIPFTLSMTTLKSVSAFTMNLALNLEPVYGIALAFWVFEENKFLGFGFYSGSLLILLSVIAHAVYKFYHYRKQKPATLANDGLLIKE